MDVTGWTLAQRMKLPDHCFGNRRVSGCYLRNGTPGTFKWGISLTPMPDPVCIWHLVITSMPQTDGFGWVRLGLADVVPTTEAEMSASVELFPEVGMEFAGPNKIIFYGKVYAMQLLPLRKGMVTDGKYLVMELRCDGGVMNLGADIVVSGLPTNVPGWPGAWPA